MSRSAAVAISRLAGLLGVTLVVVGVILGFTHLKVAGINGSLKCGSAFHAGDYRAGVEQEAFRNALLHRPDDSEKVAAECDSKRSDRRTLAIVLLVAGGVLGAGSFFISPAPVWEDDDDDEDEPT